MKTLVLAGLGLAILACAQPARADETTDVAFVAPPAASAVTEDARLANMRGMYVPNANDAGALAGSIVYFGLDMKTLWTTGASPTSVSYAAGLHVGFNLADPQHPVVNIVTSSSENASNNPDPGRATGVPGSIVGNIGANGSSGLLQAIQIAGSGNTVSNGAAITVSTIVPSLAIAPGNGAASCSVCTFTTAQPNFGVTIALPDGSRASQMLGANGIAQTAQITSNYNSIANQLNLALGVRPGSPPGLGSSLASGLLTPVPTAGIR
ncbi:MAG: hypothetical protein NVS3B16_16590 [Vulcanimicrobiaceae bacterium]